MRFYEHESHYSERDRVLGPLVDSIDGDPKFTSAADITAGNKLTHDDVDKNGTAAKSVIIVKQQRADWVTLSSIIRLARNNVRGRKAGRSHRAQ